MATAAIKIVSTGLKWTINDVGAGSFSGKDARQTDLR